MSRLEISINYLAEKLLNLGEIDELLELHQTNPLPISIIDNIYQYVIEKNTTCLCCNSSFDKLIENKLIPSKEKVRSLFDPELKTTQEITLMGSGLSPALQILSLCDGPQDLVKVYFEKSNYHWHYVKVLLDKNHLLLGRTLSQDEALMLLDNVKESSKFIEEASNLISFLKKYPNIEIPTDFFEKTLEESKSFNRIVEISTYLNKTISTELVLRKLDHSATTILEQKRDYLANSGTVKKHDKNIASKISSILDTYMPYLKTEDCKDILEKLLLKSLENNDICNYIRISNMLGISDISSLEHIQEHIIYCEEKLERVCK